MCFSWLCVYWLKQVLRGWSVAGTPSQREEQKLLALHICGGGGVGGGYD